MTETEKLKMKKIKSQDEAIAANLTAINFHFR